MGVKDTSPRPLSQRGVTDPEAMLRGMSDSAPASAPQSAAPAPVALPRAAATVVVVRDAAEGLQVLLMRRVERSNDRSSGAFVFPGGTLDRSDRSLHEWCTGLDDAAASARLRV